MLGERATRVGLALAAVLAVGLLFNPLTGIPGVESALVLGVVLPFIAATLSGRAVARQRAGELELTSAELVGDAALRGLLLWSVPALILVLDQLRIRSCQPAAGLAYLVLGPGIGVQLACFGSLLAALVVPRVPTVAALLVPLGATLWGLGEFWSTPAIFVYGQLAGWFPGTLYDVGRGFPLELISYRALSLCWIGAAVLAVIALRPVAGRPTGLRPALALPAAALLGLAIAGWAFGPELGHRSTVAAIDDALGARHYGTRCVVHAPREVPSADAWRLVRDCDFRVLQAELALGVRQEAKVHAFFYRTPEEKQRWMGAGRTYIAKPWRDEVHLQLQGWPHPVLAHEVVHVVAGRAAQGPFRVSGQLGGWFPDAGLIEGIAVAIDWRESDGMDPHRWSAAMRELDLLPPLEELLGLRFMTHAARVAYSGAGSFTRFYLDTYGAEAMREAYRTGDFAGPAGRELSELEAGWHARLDEESIDDDTLALTALYFDQPSIFETTCPHRLAELKGELSADLFARDDARATETCEQILAIDPGSSGTRAVLVGALARRGDIAAAEAQLAALDGAGATLEARAREALADARWLQGELAPAAETYRALLDAPQPEDARRLLQVKLLAIEAGGRPERILRSLFIGPKGGGSDPTSIVHLAHTLDGLRDDGLAPYLAARQLLNVQRYDLALPTLRRARARGLPTPELEREAARLEAQAAFATGQLDRAETLFRDLLADPLLRPEATDWLARIAHARPPH